MFVPEEEKCDNKGHNIKLVWWKKNSQAVQQFTRGTQTDKKCIELIDSNVNHRNWFDKLIVYLIRLFAALFTQGNDFVYYFELLLCYLYSLLSFIVGYKRLSLYDQLTKCVVHYKTVKLLGSPFIFVVYSLFPSTFVLFSL